MYYKIKFFIKELKSNLKFAYQRARYGIDESMIWSVREYLPKHILALIKQYKDIASRNIDLSYHEGFESYLEECISSLESYIAFSEDEWDIIEQYLQQGEKDPYAKYFDTKLKLLDDIKQLFSSHFFNLWW